MIHAVLLISNVHSGLNWVTFCVGCYCVIKPTLSSGISVGGGNPHSGVACITGGLSTQLPMWDNCTVHCVQVDVWVVFSVTDNSVI